MSKSHGILLCFGLQLSLLHLVQAVVAGRRLASIPFLSSSSHLRAEHPWVPDGPGHLGLTWVQSSLIWGCRSSRLCCKRCSLSLSVPGDGSEAAAPTPKPPGCSHVAVSAGVPPAALRPAAAHRGRVQGSCSPTCLPHETSPPQDAGRCLYKFPFNGSCKSSFMLRLKTYLLLS